MSLALLALAAPSAGAEYCKWVFQYQVQGSDPDGFDRFRSVRLNDYDWCRKNAREAREAMRTGAETRFGWATDCYKRCNTGIESPPWEGYSELPAELLPPAGVPRKSGYDDYRTEQPFYWRLWGMFPDPYVPDGFSFQVGRMLTREECETAHAHISELNPASDWWIMPCHPVPDPPVGEEEQLRQLWPTPVWDWKDPADLTDYYKKYRQNHPPPKSPPATLEQEREEGKTLEEEETKAAGVLPPEYPPAEECAANPAARWEMHLARKIPNLEEGGLMLREEVYLNYPTREVCETDRAWRLQLPVYADYQTLADKHTRVPLQPCKCYLPHAELRGAPAWEKLPWLHEIIDAQAAKQLSPDRRLALAVLEAAASHRECWLLDEPEYDVDVQGLPGFAAPDCVLPWIKAAIIDTARRYRVRYPGERLRLVDENRPLLAAAWWAQTLEPAARARFEIWLRDYLQSTQGGPADYASFHAHPMMQALDGLLARKTDSPRITTSSSTTAFNMKQVTEELAGIVTDFRAAPDHDRNRFLVRNFMRLDGVSRVEVPPTSTKPEPANRWLEELRKQQLEGVDKVVLNPELDSGRIRVRWRLIEPPPPPPPAPEGQP